MWLNRYNWSGRLNAQFKLNHLSLIVFLCYEMWTTVLAILTWNEVSCGEISGPYQGYRRESKDMLMNPQQSFRKALGYASGMRGQPELLSYIKLERYSISL